VDFQAVLEERLAVGVDEEGIVGYLDGDVEGVLVIGEAEAE